MFLVKKDFLKFLNFVMMKNLFVLFFVIFSFSSCADQQYDGQFTIVSKKQHQKNDRLCYVDVVGPHGDTLENLRITKNLFLNSSPGEKGYVYYDSFVGGLWFKKVKD